MKWALNMALFLPNIGIVDKLLGQSSSSGNQSIGISDTQKGVCMDSTRDTGTTELTSPPNIHSPEKDEFLEDFFSFLRSRLNIIGTSLYLLKESIEENETPIQRYIHKINEEIDSIRKIINTQLMDNGNEERRHTHTGRR